MGVKTVYHIKGRTETEGELRKIFGPNVTEVAGGWRDMRSGEVYNL
jgi:hypothetical protein